MRISQQHGANKSVSQEKYLVSAGIVAPETEVACLIIFFFYIFPEKQLLPGPCDPFYGSLLELEVIKLVCLY